MGVGAGFCMYDVVVKKFTFAIPSPDEFLSSFCEFGFKKPIHAPKMGLRAFDPPPKWGGISRNPQKAHHWAERRHMTHRSSKSVHLCD